MAEIDDLTKLDLRTGTIIAAEVNTKARHKAYKLRIDFGDAIGIKQSSAQICENYQEDMLIGTQIIAIINFPPKIIAGFKSEVLVLAVMCPEKGTVLLRPDSIVKNGEKIA